jgi:2-keto-4-pentenoate hydratase/2-oxohepta-3-ene-1,7-dioic acid hydratase in catechol pathway
VRIKGLFPGFPYGDEQENEMGRGYHIMPTFSPTLTEYVPLTLEAADDLDVAIRIDEETVFTGSTAGMDWSVVDLVRHVSTIVELEPWDVISLGDASDPMTYLEDADVVECEIEELGTLRNPIELEASGAPILPEFSPS